jgi:hypothetical protein
VQALQTQDPQRVGSYAVLGRLGSGAMGTVFLARSPGGRLVAVKVVRPELADNPEFRDRFHQEVATVRAVGGFWTAAVVDADPAAARPWLATEYVPGPTLHDAVTAHGPLPEDAVRRLVAGLAEALGAIHGAGLIHRDLKPSNVLLADDGPRVIDFGIAKALETAGLTATGMLVGTPGFLSPEQIEGREVVPASDVFALGAIVVYAATGEGPFGAGDPAALMYRAVHARPRLDIVPAGLRALVARCLDPDPARRPTPGELLAEVGTPGPSPWLPERVRTMIAERRTELAAPASPPRRPTQRYTKVAAPDESGDALPVAGSSAVFRTSRLPALVWSTIFGAGALTCASISGDASAAGNGGLTLLGLTGFVLLTVATVRMLLALIRPQRWIEVSGSGLTAGRRGHRRELAWSRVARVRVLADKRRPWLVVWLTDPASSRVDLGVDHPDQYGGYRVFPVGHEHHRRRREREVRELRAALAWYGRAHYDAGS